MAGQGWRQEWQTDLNFPARCSRQAILTSCVKTKDKTRLLHIIGQADFDPDEVFDSERETCCLLCMLITHDWTEGLCTILNRGADVNKTIQIVECCFGCTRHTITPLMAAVWSQRLDCAVILVDFGADVNYMDPCSNLSILHVAVYTNNPEAVRFLTSSSSTLEHRSTTHVFSRDVNAYISVLVNRITADDCMDLAVTNSKSIGNIDYHFNLLALGLHNMGFCEGGFTKDPAISVKNSRVRQSHCLAILRMILSSQGDVAQKVLCHCPKLLFHCCTNTDTRVLRLFIQYGADINAKINTDTLNEYHQHTFANHTDSNSITADSSSLSLLTYFLLAGFFEAAKLLVDFGARVETRDYILIKTAFNNYDKLLPANQGASYMRALYQHVTNAPSLAWLCRRTLRVDAGVRTEEAIRKLPLPDLLRNYLSGLMEL